MLTEWIRLLMGALVFGTTIVITMVVRSRMHIVGAVIAALGLVVSVAAFGALIQRYGTTESMALALFFLFTGVIGGYWITAAALPLLARPETLTPLPARSPDYICNERTAVILLSTAGPERYDARATACNQRLLVDSGALDVPATAAPFIFLSEKARYRAIGGVLSADAAANAIAEKLDDALSGNECVYQASTAWRPSRPSLAHTVWDAYRAGIDRIVVVPLGSDESYPISRAKQALEELRPSAAGVSIRFAPPLWQSTHLARRLAERIIFVTRNVSADVVGVVLVGEGQPPSWVASHPGWSEQENYFAQRVRLHLTERGLDEHHIRIGWLEWQLPDVTEVVRHLAALGCMRVIVAPGMVPLPTLATAIDMEHAIRMARLDEAVSVVTLAPWADDDTVVDVLAEGVRSVLHSP
ncbi:MAG: ferrochelatase [Coriobacteriia bacterium]|nr:ferrochelatase [Coriobacteriia bacterium]